MQKHVKLNAQYNFQCDDESTHKKSHDLRNHAPKTPSRQLILRYSSVETRNRFYDAFKVMANSLYSSTTFSLLFITLIITIRYIQVHSCTYKCQHEYNDKYRECNSDPCSSRSPKLKCMK